MSQPRSVQPPNTLKKKVGSGGFDPVKLEKAQDAIVNNKIDMKAFAYEMIGAMNEVTEGDDTLEDKIKFVLFPMMQLNAHGAMFQYGSISRLSIIIIDFLEKTDTHDPRIFDLVEGYRASVKALVDKTIKSDKDPACLAFCKAMEDACDRYHKKIGF
jgi:hypothetical protein